MALNKNRDAAVLYINHERHEVRGEEAFMMLADYLRYKRGLVGTKIVCAEGDCGACSVLKASYLNGRSEGFEVINACIISVAQLDACQIVTVEGLSEGGQLSAVQESVAACHASQCGYCTPGFVVAITACLESGKKDLNEQKIKNCLTGNLCRCTGYTSLIEAALKAQPSVQLSASLASRYLPDDRQKDLKAIAGIPLEISFGDKTFCAPVLLKDALQLRSKMPLTLMASGSDLGVMINKGKANPKTQLSLHLLPDLYKIDQDQNRLTFGARVTLTELRKICEKTVPEFANFLNIFASPQIKNIGTLVGNVANASPIGDTVPFLMVADTLVHVASSRGTRNIPLTEFYLAYRKMSLEADEIIASVSFAIPKQEDRLRIFKVSQRKDLDISTVNSAFLFRMKDDHPSVVSEARIAYGGIGPVIRRFPAVETFLVGKALEPKVIDQALGMIQGDILPLSDVRGTSAYRRNLVDGMFRRFCEELGQKATHQGAEQHV